MTGDMDGTLQITHFQGTLVLQGPVARQGRVIGAHVLNSGVGIDKRQ